MRGRLQRIVAKSGRRYGLGLLVAAVVVATSACLEPPPPPVAGDFFDVTLTEGLSTTTRHLPSPPAAATSTAQRTHLLTTRTVSFVEGGSLNQLQLSSDAESGYGPYFAAFESAFHGTYDIAALPFRLAVTTADLGDPGSARVCSSHAGGTAPDPGAPGGFSYPPSGATGTFTIDTAAVPAILPIAPDDPPVVIATTGSFAIDCPGGFTVNGSFVVG